MVVFSHDYVIPILFSIPELTVFNSAIAWDISIFFPQISSSSSLVPSTPSMIGTTVTFMFHTFFSTLLRARYLSSFSFSYNFTQGLTETPESTDTVFSLFMIARFLLGHPFEFQSLTVSSVVHFSQTISGLYIWSWSIFFNYNFCTVFNGSNFPPIYSYICILSEVAVLIH